MSRDPHPFTAGNGVVCATCDRSPFDPTHQTRPGHNHPDYGLCLPSSCPRAARAELLDQVVAGLLDIDLTHLAFRETARAPYVPLDDVIALLERLRAGR